MSLLKVLSIVQFFWKTHVNHFLMISSEISILATSCTSYLEVSYLQKIVLYFSTLLYHDLFCELWKIYYAEFHALGWLSECWFTGSICRQYFFLSPSKYPESCLHLQLWGGCTAWCIPDIKVLASHGFAEHFVILWQLSVFLKMIRGYRIWSNSSRFPCHKEWVDSQPSPPAGPYRSVLL